jgi:hypothetical protein
MSKGACKSDSSIGDTSDQSSRGNSTDSSADTSSASSSQVLTKSPSHTQPIRRVRRLQESQGMPSESLDQLCSPSRLKTYFLSA